MRQFLTIAQIFSSLGLIILILIQARGTGFGRTSAGSFSRRGLEKLTFRLTFVLAAVFLIVSVLSLYG